MRDKNTKHNNNATDYGIIQSILQLQKDASDPNTSCFVSASAGTGKTKVLVDRFLRIMIEKCIAPKNILCITYTNTAADEIKSRILSKLNLIRASHDKKIALKEFIPFVDNKMLDSFNAQYDLFVEDYNELKIYTIHSFCYQILNQYWKLKGLPAKQVIDFKASTLGISSAINNAILNNKESALYLLEKYELKHIQNILKSALNCRTISGYSFKSIKPKFDPMKDLYKSKLKAYIEQVLGFRFLNQNNMENVLQDIFLTKSGAKRKRISISKINGQDLDKEMLKSLQDVVCEVFEKNKEYKFQMINYHINVLFEVVCYEYEAFKNQRLTLDFNDILNHTLKVLKEDPDATAILYHIDLTIDHILVDEAQDTSPIQWEVIKLISSEYYSGITRRNFVPTVFIVGDFKQSIYSFQGADPQSFLEVKHYFKNMIENIGAKFRDIEFNTSFRSESTILNYVDKVFASRTLAHAISGRDQKIVHVPFKSQYGAVILNEIVKPQQKIKFKNQKELSSDELLAVRISEDIMFHVKHQRLVVGTEYCIQYKDVMVIFRKRSEAYYKLIEILNSASVPVSSNRAINLNTSSELQYIKNLIQFILFPYDDYNLYEFLKSPFFLLPNNMITKIFYNRGKRFGFDVSRETFPELYKKLNQFLSMRNLDILSLLQKVFITCNYKQKFIQRFGLVFKSLYYNLIEVISARTGDKPISLLDFYTNHFEELQVHEEFNNDFEGVKVITVHAAKGLQSKVVILADTTTTDNQPNDLVIENHDKNNLMFIPSKDAQPQHLTEYLKRKKLGEYCESLRLLYVALTRAENEVHIYGRENKSIENSWYQVLVEAYEDDTDFCTQYKFIYKEGKNRYRNSNFVFKLPHYNYSQNEIPHIQMKRSGVIAFYNKGLQSGSIMHKFLYQLSFLKPKNFGVIRECITKFTYEFDLAANIIEKYPEIFNSDYSKNILSEVEIATIDNIKGLKQNYIIDKLVISNGEIKIIDFKNDANVNESTIGKYREQLLMYKNIMQSIYPRYRINSYLLFCHHHKILHEIT